MHLVHPVLKPTYVTQRKYRGRWFL